MEIERDYESALLRELAFRKRVVLAFGLIVSFILVTVSCFGLLTRPELRRQPTEDDASLLFSRGLKSRVGPCGGSCYDDGDVCNGVEERCDRETNVCIRRDIPVCDDRNVCNGYETCKPFEGCKAGVPLVCDDGNACNGVETCNPDYGCQPGIALNCGSMETDPCKIHSCDAKDGCKVRELICTNGQVCDAAMETCVDPK